MDSFDIVDKVFENATKGNRLIKNSDVLKLDYIPNKILYRDIQTEKIASVLSPVLNMIKPSNLFIYGKTGTGKTMVTKFVMKALEGKKNNDKIIISYINSRTSGTIYRVLSDIALSLKIKVPFTGLSVSEVQKRIFSYLKENEIRLLLVLDEVDFLVNSPLKKDAGNDLLYELTRYGSYADSNSFISIIGISNDIKFKDYLESRVYSSLHDEEVFFTPYSVEELKDILKERANIAFIDNAITDDVINLIAARSGGEHGDARRAVDLLRVAAELAERENAKKIEIRHVQEASKNMEQDKVSEAISSLPIQEKLVLLTIVSLQDTENTGHIYIKYIKICENLGIQPLTQRRVSAIINELDMLGLISAPVINRGRYGRSKKISLALDKSTVIKTIKEDETLKSLNL
ncbi:MAG: orc1/cdc6 family replication initiation protein [Conexivisphaerales archaeon]